MTAENGVQEQVLSALRHPEAEEGLYFDNFFHLHEEDTRPKVQATELEILNALEILIAEGKVVADGAGEHVVFRLNTE